MKRGFNAALAVVLIVIVCVVSFLPAGHAEACAVNGRQGALPDGATTWAAVSLGADESLAQEIAESEASFLAADPPFVVDHKPVQGEEQPADAPVVLIFNKEMDKASVQAAFAITPTVPVDFTWDEATQVSVLPQSGEFERGETYRVILSGGAKSKEGMRLAKPVDFTFPVVGYLEVTEVMPADGTTEVDMKSTVTVIFNRPVVPLTSLGQQASLPQPLAFTPQVMGKGEWLNTSIYTFTPDEGFAPATKYKARVKAGLTGLMGSVVENEYTWTFTTKLPAVTAVSPRDEAIYVGPSDHVKVTFNQPMDHESTEKSFTLEESETGDPVSGTFSWSSEDVDLKTEEMDAGGSRGTLTEALRGETMTFAPDEALALGTPYQANVAKGAKAVDGQKGTTTSYSWTFSTILPPAVKSTDPEDGDKNADYSGGVDIYFTSPISPSTLVDNLTIIPEPTRVYSYWYSSNTELYLSWGIKPSSSYTVTIGKDLQGRYGHKLGKDAAIRFTTRQADPYISLINQGRIGTYSSYTDTMAYVSFRNVSEITYKLYSLSTSDFFKMTGSDQWQYWNDFKPHPDRLIRKWKKEIHAPLNQYAIVGTRPAATKKGGLSPGLYYLEVDSPSTSPSQQVMVVSPYNIIFKQSQKASLVWVTDLKTGEVVPNLTVKIYDEDGRVLAQGKTDQDGVYQGTYEEIDSWETMYVLVGDDDLPTARFGAVLNDWSNGIDSWDFNINGEMYSQDYNAYIYTDRPIYRPGQKVYFKGILRKDDWSVYSLPEAGRPITVTVENGQGEQIYEEILQLNDMGTFHSSLSLAEAASLGYYYLQAQVVEGEVSFGASFQVAEYKKPQFQVKVETDKPEYLQGDKINVHAKAEYYFGGPVAGAKVHWSVMSEDAPFDYKGKGWYDFTDYDWGQDRYYSGYYGGLVTEGDGVTDENGEFTFSVPADIADQINSQRYTIEASVTAPNDQQVSNHTGTIIHKGLFYVGLAPQRYVGSANEESKTNVITVDWESEPKGNISVTLVYNKHEWYSVEEKGDDGTYHWTSKSVDTPVYTETVKTDKEGEAVGSFTPDKGGSYRIIATAEDEKGNTIRSSTFLWISGRKFVNWRQENNDRIDLVADRKTYDVGDTAEVLIPSPYQGEVQALLTIERGGVISHKLLELKTNSDTVSIPILPDYVPNVFVSVALVKGVDENNPLASFKLGYVTLNVSTEEKELKITLTPDKEQYQPGDTATYQVEAVNHEGDGQEAELSLNLVDKSVLALADSSQGTLMDTFWSDRGVGVQTAASLVISVDRRNLEVAPEAKGGGGGGEAPGMTVRSRFPDTAYWNPVVRTDADGKAEVKLQLPDNLTTWNMSAKAVTVNTEVGEAQVDVKSTLPLHVQSILPRFFVVGDQAKVGTVVFNETDDAFEVEVDLSAKGAQMASGAQKVKVPAHGNVKVRWDVTVTDAKNATFTFSAKGGGLSDAEEHTLPVYRYTSPETVATSGEVNEGETRTELVQIPTRADPDQGELTLELSPSLAAGTREGLAYLEIYPYYCIEQTVSRFVPNVLTYKAVSDLGVEDEDLKVKLLHFVTVGLQRIYASQKMNGGWGWWLADDSNPFMTAYVLFGLVQTDRAGFTVEPEVINQAVGYLEAHLDQSTDTQAAARGNTEAFVLYVMADTGVGDLGRTVALFKHRDQLGQYGKAFLAMALHILEPEVDTRVNALMSDLNNDAITSATGVHWEEATQDYWTMSTDTRSTSIVLEALVKIQPDNPLIPNVVRWLMAVRQDGRWESTQETAWAVMALTDYMVVSGELEADYSYKVLMNGDTWTERTVDAKNLDEPEVVQKAMSDLLHDALNQVSMTRLPPTGDQTGDGKLYYSMFLKYFLPVPEIKALNHGVMLARQYSLESDPDKLIDSAEMGDVIQVKLTIVAPNNLHYLVVEDPLPAGCEALDQSLKTTSIVGQRPELTRVGTTVRGYWGWWWFSHTELRDDKVALFATYLPKGTYEYTYLMRAGLPGEFRVLPATAYEMYFPEVFGRGDGGLFTIDAGEK